MFEIEDPEVKVKRRMDKRRRNDKLFYIALGFLLLTLVLLLVYYFTSNKPVEKKATPKKPKVIEKKLTIIDQDSNERVIAYMIDNNIGGGRHAGLQESFVNYEIIVEGGLTRIMALFKDKNVELVGPIRSSRHYFLDYALEYDAIYAHYGWSPYAEKDIKALGVNNINGMTDGTPYYRDKSIAAPHNVFTSTSKVRDYLSEKGYNKESSNWKVLNYSADEIDISEKNEEGVATNPANNISMSYSQSQSRSYSYDTNNKYYLRSMNGASHIDKVSGTQLHYKNIIIIKVNNKTLDREGRQDLDTVGSGDGFYITNGFSKPIKWSKSNRNSKTTYSYLDGSEVKINDGNTFIQIVPTYSNIQIG